MNAGAKTAKVADETRASDAPLVQRCLEGDEKAWSDLITKYKNLIFSIPIRYGLSQQDAADIFQAVCISLLQELPRIREPNAIGAWLIQVTRSKCFHNTQRGLGKNTEDIRDFDLQTSQDAESLIYQVQQDQLVREALNQLSPRCRQLVNMLFFEVPVRSYHEIAEELKLATGSVGLTRRRCLDDLQRRLEHLGFNHDNSDNRGSSEG